jgi:hypothetical protein
MRNSGTGYAGLYLIRQTDTAKLQVNTSGILDLIFADVFKVNTTSLVIKNLAAKSYQTVLSTSNDTVYKTDLSVIYSPLADTSLWAIQGNNIYNKNLTYNVGIGTTDPTAMLHVKYDQNITGVQITRVQSNAANPLLVFRKARGVIGTETIIQANDYLGQVRFEGWDGDSWVQGAWILSQVMAIKDDTIGANLQFYTNNYTKKTADERMRLTYLGNLGIASTAPAQRLDVDGNIICDTLFGFTHTPSTGTVTSIVHGNGMDFSEITTTGTVTMGTPATLTGITTNALTEHSHTHAITTAAVANSSTDLSDGNDIFDFVETYWTKSGDDLYSSVSGNVGVGGVHPSQKFEVVGNGRFQKIGIGIPPTALLDISGVLITTINALQIADNEAAGSYFKITDGTNTASRFMPTIYGQAVYTGVAGTGLRFVGIVGEDGADDAGINFDGRNAASALTTAAIATFKNYDTEYVRFGFDGNIGVGSTAPSQKIDVVGNINLDGAYLFNGDSLELSDLKLVDIVSAADGEYLKFDGTRWINFAPESGGTVTNIDIGAGLTGAANPITTTGDIKLGTAKIISDTSTIWTDGIYFSLQIDTTRMATIYDVSSAGGGTVMEVSAGNGMNFSTITSTGAVTLGTPSTLTGITTNAATGTTHTHAITTAAVTNGSTNIVTGNDVFDFQEDNYWKHAAGKIYNIVGDNVGIGSASPAAKLDVVGYVQAENMMLTDLDEDGSNDVALVLDGNVVKYNDLSDEFAPIIHNHDASYISIISPVSTGYFPTMTAGGELANSIYNAAYFATAGHVHSALTDATNSGLTDFSYTGGVAVAIGLGTPSINTVNGTNNVTGISHGHAADTVGYDGFFTQYDGTHLPALIDGYGIKDFSYTGIATATVEVDTATLRTLFGAGESVWDLVGDDIDNSNAGDVSINGDFYLLDNQEAILNYSKVLVRDDNGKLWWRSDASIAAAGGGYNDWNLWVEGVKKKDVTDGVNIDFVSGYGIDVSWLNTDSVSTEVDTAQIPTMYDIRNVDNWVKLGNNQYSGVSGNVGIGTTQPRKKFEVNDNSYFDGDMQLGNTFTLTVENIKADLVAPLKLTDASDNLGIYIGDNGNVGIGTVSGSVLLRVEGDVGIGYSTVTGAGDEDLAISGNLGIGTSTMSNKLDVYGWSYFDQYVSLGYADISGLTTMLSVNGNVGIGTTLTANKLEVNGNINILNGNSFMIDGVPIVTGSGMQNWVVKVNDGTVATISNGENVDFADATGIDINFYNNDSISFSTNDAEIVHDNLSGFEANEHINHTLTLTAGNGLTGGGDITANRTFALGTPTTITTKTVNGLTADSFTIAADTTGFDGFATNYDIKDFLSATDIRDDIHDTADILRSEFPAGGGDVTKVGTPANDQVGVWTGDGTLEGDADLIFNGANLGIGTTDASTRLYVNGTVTATQVDATIHATNILVDHVGEHTGAHGIIFDNDITRVGTAKFDHIAEATGSHTIIMDNTVGVDHLVEVSAAHGVNADGVTLKDGGALVITGGSNTFNLTNGSAVLDIAASSTLNVDANLTVETASIVNQDLTSDASPTFNQGNFTTVHTTTLLSDHIGEHGAAHTVVIDNTLALGANNLTMTGSIAATGARVFKGWFTDLECTNAIAGSITGNAATVTTVGANTTNYVSKWNGTALVAGTIYDNTNIGIGTSTTPQILSIVGQEYVSGNIGIGITNPAHNLSVTGTAYFSGATANVGIGITNPVALLEVSKAGTGTGEYQCLYQLDGTGTNGGFRKYYDGVAGALLLLQKGRGTIASPTAVNSSDWGGRLRADVWYGSDWRTLGSIDFYCDDTTSTSATVQGSIRFLTMASAATSANEKMRITPAGNVGIATTAPAQVLSVTGNAYISANVGIGSSVPAAAIDFRGGMIAQTYLLNMSDNYTVTASDYIIIVTAVTGGKHILLPVETLGRILYVFNNSGSDVILWVHDGIGTWETLATDRTCMLVGDGTNWNVMLGTASIP